MKVNFVAFVAGIVFAIGLGISGMTMPSKIVGFLDVAGAWDLSLGFVMVGAIAVYSVLFHLAVRRPAPLLAPAFAIPTRADIDSRLIAGSALFGIGWGIGGFCPGPAMVSLAWASAPVVLFVLAMCAGMYSYAFLSKVRAVAVPLGGTSPAISPSPADS